MIAKFSILTLPYALIKLVTGRCIIKLENIQLQVTIFNQSAHLFLTG